MTPRFGIVGRKNAGKTTLVAKLVAHLVARGIRVATIKHAHHTLDVDREGTDSWKHREAGAGEVALVGANRWAIMHELGDAPEPSLDEIAARMSPADIVIIEGYKGGLHPKIEVRRGTPPLDPAQCPNILAVAGDGGRFGADDIPAIAAFVLEHAGIAETAH